MKWTKDKVNEAIKTIFGKLAEGLSDRDIMDAMGLDSDEYGVLRKRMLDSKSDELRTRPQEHIYVEYLINQIRNIRDLTDMIDDFKHTKQANALVGAIRARAEIHNMLVAKGQEFGLIKKTPDRKEIVAGVLVADLTNEELKKEIMGELKGLNKLMKHHGDQNIINMQESDGIYHGPGLPPPSAPIMEPMSAPSANKVAISKVSKGRKMTMPSAPIDVSKDD